MDIVERKYYEWRIGFCSRQIVGGEEGIFFKGNSKMRGLDIVQRKKYEGRMGYCSRGIVGGEDWVLFEGNSSG